jgi:hypothetical protein
LSFFYVSVEIRESAELLFDPAVAGARERTIDALVEWSWGLPPPTTTVTSILLAPSPVANIDVWPEVLIPQEDIAIRPLALAPPGFTIDPMTIDELCEAKVECLPHSISHKRKEAVSRDLTYAARDDSDAKKLQKIWEPARNIQLLRTV